MLPRFDWAERCGVGRAIEDNPDHRSAVFDRLRPSAPKLFGRRVQIDLAPRP